MFDTILRCLSRIWVTILTSSTHHIANWNQPSPTKVNWTSVTACLLPCRSYEYWALFYNLMSLQPTVIIRLIHHIHQVKDYLAILTGDICSRMYCKGNGRGLSGSCLYWYTFAHTSRCNMYSTNEKLEQCIISQGKKAEFIIHTLSRRWDGRVNWKPICAIPLPV